jgi:hypothetical protein
MTSRHGRPRPTPVASGCCALVVLTACANPRVPPPPELDPVPIWKLELTSGLLTMKPEMSIGPHRVGPYRVDAIARGPVLDTGGLRDALLGRSRLHERYGLRVTEEGDSASFAVDCAIDEYRARTRIGDFEFVRGESKGLECVTRQGDVEVGVLRLTSVDGAAPTGALLAGETEYRIESQLGGRDVARYLIARPDGGLVACAEISHDQGVRMTDGIAGEDRHIVAAAIIALLFERRLHE